MPRAVALSDDERFPLISEERRGLLRRLRQHPRAPIWNFASGDRLDAAGLAALRAWEARLRAGPEPWGPGGRPGWLDGWAEETRAKVPFYRSRAPAGADFARLPTFRRADLAAAPWAFVPDDQPLDQLLVYPTSGTTGPAFEVFSHPVVSNAWFPFVQAALARLGLGLEGGSERVALATVHAQRGTLTYPSLVSWLGGAGFVKVNLDPGQWRAPGDAAAFLDDCAPELYAGDPLAFAALAELPLKHRPVALVSAATALLPGHRAALEARFGCPVLDVYSLTEARMVAVSWGGGHEIISPDIYVEIMDPSEDRPLPPGERGEVVLSGGHNPFLPLLRYRTGDFARLGLEGDRAVLLDLEGRPPVRLLDAAGALVNTIDVSRALAPFALAGFHLRQEADRALSLRYEGYARPAQLRLALEPLFAGLPLAVEEGLPRPPSGGKVLQFSSALAGGPRGAVFGEGA